ncbi:3'-5' exonuclease [Clostridium cylindrosporum]|uniref:DNA polymerase III PolC n=1 Tax=Clostridium cylindrosporum DSM 605 TaxID=1121307 RepID=A0A0J8G1I3_CLOCY|nr:3'-5' exonuclease [Clostridium cylindrosporum]KMT21621.1 DNA polymerase III PolC [Clostridium cylindrosporum DSM 605]
MRALYQEGSRYTCIDNVKGLAEVDVNFEKYEGFTDTFVAIDIETTGLKYDENKIIQLSGIKYKDGKEIARFDEYINPKVYIPRFITEINGITNEMVKTMPTIDEVIPKFVEFLEDFIIVAHNSKFDMKFILFNLHMYNVLNSNAINLNNKVVDTLLLSRRYLNGIVENNKLITLKKHFNIVTEKEHCGIDDAYSCAELYLRISEIVNKI